MSNLTTDCPLGSLIDEEKVGATEQRSRTMFLEKVIVTLEKNGVSTKRLFKNLEVYVQTGDGKPSRPVLCICLGMSFHDIKAVDDFAAVLQKAGFKLETKEVLKQVQPDTEHPEFYGICLSLPEVSGYVVPYTTDN